MKDKNESSRRKWDLMIGITLIVFGGLRLFNHFRTNADWELRSYLTILFIGYGIFLVYRYFQNKPES